MDLYISQRYFNAGEFNEAEWNSNFALRFLFLNRYTLHHQHILKQFVLNI